MVFVVPRTQLSFCRHILMNIVGANHTVFVWSMTLKVSFDLGTSCFLI